MFDYSCKLSTLSTLPSEDSELIELTLALLSVRRLVVVEASIWRLVCWWIDLMDC